MDDLTVASAQRVTDLFLSQLDRGGAWLQSWEGRSEILFRKKRRGLCCVGGTLWVMRGSGAAMWR